MLSWEVMRNKFKSFYTFHCGLPLEIVCKLLVLDNNENFFRGGLKAKCVSVFGVGFFAALKRRLERSAGRVDTTTGALFCRVSPTHARALKMEDVKEVAVECVREMERL